MPSWFVLHKDRNTWWSKMANRNRQDPPSGGGERRVDLKETFIPTRNSARFQPRIISADPSYARRELAASVLPKDMTLAPGARRSAAGFFGSTPMGMMPNGGGGGGSAMYHMQRPYLPQVESPDRVQFPKSRQEANEDWRFFHKVDPILGTAIDMYAEMMVSDYDIVIGDESSREIGDTLEYMCERVSLIEKLKYIIREYLLLGEAFPHCFFDDDLGIWTYIGMHNPDYVEVMDAPIVNMDPILNFVPDENTRRLLSDGSPEAREFRQRLPAEFVSKIMARQKIRLSPLNATMIARKLHPYDVRGTSIVTRMWRIFMVEDAVYNSTIATFRRHASPVKVIKLGDPATGWIPAPGSETKLLEMLTRAESDPQCLVPETPVTLVDGTWKGVGDLRLGEALSNRKGGSEQVLALQEEWADKLVHLDVVGVQGEIRCTPLHKWPIWGGPRTCMCGCGRKIRRGNFVAGHSFYVDGGYEYAPREKGAPYKTKEGKVRFLSGFDPRQKVTADQIHEGDYLMLPRGFEEGGTSGVTPAMARLLGYYVAEGNSILVYEREDGSRRMGVEFSFNVDEKHTLVADVCKIVESLAGYSPETFDGDRNNCQVRVRRNASSSLAEWLVRHGGSGARTKKLSLDVMSWPLALKREFLRGYVGGDGSSIAIRPSSDRRYVEVTSSSEDLIHQVRLILVQLGTYSSLSSRPNDKSFSGGGIQHRLHVHGAFADLLSREMVGLKSSCKRNDPHMWWADEDYVYVKIRKAHTVKYRAPQRVINMTVSGDHSYQAFGFGTYNSWLIYHYGINFEAWGTTDKAINISQHNDTIEKVKLLALGLSKSFVSGETTYASSKSGLQVFLRRLLSLRQFLESVWLYPKFFRPISQINEWYTSKPSEVNNKYRIKRTAQEIEEENMLLMPTLKWKNKLDPSVDADILNAYKMLEGFGIRVRKSTVAAAAGLDAREELQGAMKEFKEEKELIENTLGNALGAQFLAAGQQAGAAAAGGGAKPPGLPGAGAKPPSAAGAPPGKPGGGMDDASHPPGSAAGGGGSLDEAIQRPEGGGLPTGVM